MQDNPILVEVTRGSLVESCHRGSAAIADADGRVLLSLGDVEGPVYPRSAVKAMQALPLIESGAAAAFSLGEAELAIACASHSGEEAHISIELFRPGSTVPAFSFPNALTVASGFSQVEG